MLSDLYDQYNNIMFKKSLICQNCIYKFDKTFKLDYISYEIHIFINIHVNKSFP